MRRIKLSRTKGEGADYVFDVSVDKYKYKVSFSAEYYQRLTDGQVPPEELARKSFKFLLEREGPESILREFDLSIINVYFPEYEVEMREGL